MAISKKGKSIEDIGRYLEEALDKVTAILILKTLKLIYRVNESEIISNPDKFESVMKIMLGHSAKDILRNIHECMTMHSSLPHSEYP